ncbi:MAG: hypothetical protein ABJD49_00240 [Parasphingorhabdus sp.]
MPLGNAGDKITIFCIIPNRIKRPVGFEIGAPVYRFFCSSERRAAGVIGGWFAEYAQIDDEIRKLDFYLASVLDRNPNGRSDMFNGLTWIRRSSRPPSHTQLAPVPNAGDQILMRSGLNIAFTVMSERKMP